MLLHSKCSGTWPDTPLSDTSLSVTKLPGFPLQAEETEEMFRLYEPSENFENEKPKTCFGGLLRASGGC